MTGLSGSIPEHFIVVVPGVMGSKLRDRESNRVVWVDFASVPLNPLDWDDWLDRFFADLTYPNDTLEPAGIMDELVFVPPWAKQEHYGRLFRALSDLGYNADPTHHAEPDLDVYAFAYDWRQDNRRSAQHLAEAIERWRTFHPGAEAWIIAHSMGGLVARWYIEHLGGKDRVGRLILMASPWDGAPQAMRVLFTGLDTLLRGYFNAVYDVPGRTRDLVRGFPSTYQLLPHTDPFLRGRDNELIDPFSAPGWLDDAQHREYLADGRRFNQELGTATSVETLCFFGRRRPTTTFGVVGLEAGGQWEKIDWGATDVGDGTVPERSAVHPQATAQLPFAAGHGDIYVNPAVLEFLRWELVDKFRGAINRAFVATGQHTVTFQPDRDVYRPGEPIHLMAVIERNAPGHHAVPRSRIRVSPVWRGPLPGTAITAPPGVSGTDLQASGEDGRYEGVIRAPEAEGYYALEATVEVGGEQVVQLEELIAVERDDILPAGKAES